MSTDAGTPTPSKFIYKLNAMENAGAQITPAKHGYKEKREAVLAYVANLESDLTALRAAHEAAQAEIAALRVNDARYKARRKNIFEARLRMEVPGHRNWRPTTFEEFCAEYNAACDKEVAEQAVLAVGKAK